jgi:hypothetical protein
MNTHPPDVIEQNKETTRMKEVLVCLSNNRRVQPLRS